MAILQKSFSSLFNDGIIPERYDKEIGEFLTKIGDKLQNIAYSSAASVVTVADGPAIQTITKQRVRQVVQIIHNTYIVYEGVAEPEKQPLHPLTHKNNLKPVQ